MINIKVKLLKLAWLIVFDMIIIAINFSSVKVLECFRVFNKSFIFKSFISFIISKIRYGIRPYQHALMLIQRKGTTLGIGV